MNEEYPLLQRATKDLYHNFHSAGLHSDVWMSLAQNMRKAGCGALSVSDYIQIPAPLLTSYHLRKVT